MITNHYKQLKYLISVSYSVVKKIMKIKIEGNPGTGNSFTEVNIGHVENYNPAATTVVNNYYGYGKAPQVPVATNTNKTVLRQEILDYVSKTLPFVLYQWKDKYMDLWSDILSLPEVEAVIYNPGRQRGTAFNRKEVAHIICYLGKHAVDGMGIFQKYNATRIATTFRDGAEKSVRPELGFRPSKDIQVAIDKLLKNQNVKSGNS